MRHATKTGIENASTSMDAIVLTPSEGTKIITGMYNAGVYKRTPLLRGSPGCGKTSAVRMAAEELRKAYPNFQYIEINPTMPADEVGGIPDLIRMEGQATRTDYALPKWFPKASENPDWKGIICLDDALQGDRMMQQTLANLILARNLRGHDLPEGAMIVATGNRMEDKAGVTRTLSHFADRMCWLNIAAEANAWINDFAIPKGLDQRIIGYIMFDKSKLDMFDPNVEKCSTSRTWEAVNGHLKFLDSFTDPSMGNARNKFAQAILAGELGMGEATAFWAFCNMFGSLPNIDDLLKDPANAPIDYKLDVQYALALAIANRIDEHNIAAALEYITRIGPDLTTLAAKVAFSKNSELKRTEAWAKWAIKNQDVVCAS